LKISDINCILIIFFSSPELFEDLYHNATNFCGTVRPNQKGMRSTFGKKLKTEGIKTRVKGELTATIWKDK
jgi:hypothetical protein